MRPDQNACLFADSIFKCIVLNEMFEYLMKYQWNMFWRPNWWQVSIDLGNNSTPNRQQVTAWTSNGWPRSMVPYDIQRPWLVKFCSYDIRHCLYTNNHCLYEMVYFNIHVSMKISVFWQFYILESFSFFSNSQQKHIVPCYLNPGYTIFWVMVFVFIPTKLCNLNSL